MSLRNRINQFFNKPKSSPEAPSSPTEATSAEQGAVTWDSLAAERRDDDKPQITYDDLARLVRFPGSAPAEKAVPSEKSTPAEESTSAETSSADLQAPVFDALETVNGGGVVI